MSRRQSRKLHRSQRRHQPRGFGVLRLLASHQCYDAQQRDQHRIWGVQYVHQPDQHHDTQQRDQHRRGAFSWCTSLTGAYFEGTAPTGGSNVFYGSTTTIYYLPGTTGWGTTFSGRPTAPWVLPHPVILTTAPNFGIKANQFGFRISWATNVPVVVETSSSLANPVWSPVSTNTLTDGWSDFRDAEWKNHPARFYRFGSCEGFGTKVSRRHQPMLNLQVASHPAPILRSSHQSRGSARPSF